MDYLIPAVLLHLDFSRDNSDMRQLLIHAFRAMIRSYLSNETFHADRDKPLITWLA